VSDLHTAKEVAVAFRRFAEDAATPQGRAVCLSLLELAAADKVVATLVDGELRFVGTGKLAEVRQ
jgi:hypothetical protein